MVTRLCARRSAGPCGPPRRRGPAYAVPSVPWAPAGARAHALVPERRNRAVEILVSWSSRQAARNRNEVRRERRARPVAQTVASGQRAPRLARPRATRREGGVGLRRPASHPLLGGGGASTPDSAHPRRARGAVSVSADHRRIRLHLSVDSTADDDGFPAYARLRDRRTLGDL